MSKKKKFVIDLPRSEHREVKVTLQKINDDPRCFDRAAYIDFPSDGMDIRIYMMESDLRVLARELLENTSKKSELDYE